ncbi:MAG TPA: LLM class flavin-dependent oxidoreductase [Myxococcota bacterium]|nr:LLM class flavin-dependent oxidoreductase [Myxococcota bacterium]
MSAQSLPAVALAAVPGRRRATLELALEIERREFAGIYCASFGDAMGLCEALALVTQRISFGTAIANLYTRHPSDYASSAAMIHELSGGRFRFGVGVSHDPVNRRLGLRTGRPMADARHFVEELRAAARVGELPPIVLAALRERMVALAGEIAEGVVFANVARSHVARSLQALPPARRRDSTFFVGDMIPVCISDDRAAAMERNRKTLVMYVSLPNYRNYWKEAGYVEEMEAIEKAVAQGRSDLTGLMSDRWLADVTLFGSAAEIRDGVERWREAGVTTPILVPSSARGNQMNAFEELFAAFAPR